MPKEELHNTVIGSSDVKELSDAIFDAIAKRFPEELYKEDFFKIIAALVSVQSFAEDRLKEMGIDFKKVEVIKVDGRAHQ